MWYSTPRSNLKSETVRNILSKHASLRVNLNIDDDPLVSRSLDYFFYTTVIVRFLNDCFKFLQFRRLRIRNTTRIVTLWNTTFPASGVELVQHYQDQFRFRRTVFYSHFKSKVDNILTETHTVTVTVLRVNCGSDHR